MSDQQPVTVRDDPDRRGYFASVADGSGGTIEVGGAYYRRQDGVVTFTHTEVDPDLEGQGVGSALARTALDAARTAGDRVVPQCPFIEEYIERHPEYQSLLDPA